MEGKYHFATPIAPPGTQLLMHKNPGRQQTFGYNANKTWYTGPCFKNYRTFKGILASTGAERISDTVRFQHNAIAVSQLTPADCILEATKQLKLAIQQQPATAPMGEITAITLLRQVLLGEHQGDPPKNSVQKARALQQPTTSRDNPIKEPSATAYVSNDEDGITTIQPKP